MRRLLVALALVAACQKASDQGDTRQLPKLPPPPVAAQQPLAITVEIDGKPAPAIDNERLHAVPPDYQDAEHRAWKLSTLLGAVVTQPSALVEITGDQSVTIVVRDPSPGGLVPVLMENRRGGIIAAVVPRDQPFPPYHGQGRQLQRPGDPQPRLSGVTRMRVRHDP